MAARKSAQDSLRSSIDSFVADLTSLFRDSILSVVSGQSSSSRTSQGKGTAGSGRKGAKRDPRVIAALTSRLADFIAKNPGKRIEQIGQELKVSTRDLVLSVRKLLAEKLITTRGQRRATSYFPAKGGGRRTAKKTGKRRVKKKKTKARANKR